LVRTPPSDIAFREKGIRPSTALSQAEPTIELLGADNSGFKVPLKINSYDIPRSSFAISRTYRAAAGLADLLPDWTPRRRTERSLWERDSWSLLRQIWYGEVVMCHLAGQDTSNHWCSALLALFLYSICILVILCRSDSRDTVVLFSSISILQSSSYRGDLRVVYSFYCTAIEFCCNSSYDPPSVAKRPSELMTAYLDRRMSLVESKQRRFLFIL
jgi:hypothetical protein